MKRLILFVFRSENTEPCSGIFDYSIVLEIIDAFLVLVHVNGENFDNHFIAQKNRWTGIG